MKIVRLTQEHTFKPFYVMGGEAEPCACRRDGSTGLYGAGYQRDARMLKCIWHYSR